MSQPAVTAFADELYGSLAPFAYADEAEGWPLLHLLDAVGQMFQPVDDLVGDTPGGPGWSQVIDVDRAPAEALGWLAQMVGVTLLAGLSDAAQRDRIRSTDGMKRGSLAAVVGAAQQHLTGSRSVVIRERDASACPTEPAYGLTVITFTAETPTPTVTLVDILAQKPIGLVLNYLVEDGQDFEQLRTGYTTFDAVRTTYSTFDAVRTSTP